QPISNARMMFDSDSVGGAEDSRNGFSKRRPVNDVERSAMVFFLCHHKGHKGHKEKRRFSFVSIVSFVAAGYERGARFRNVPAPARPTNLPSSITRRPRDSTVSVAPVTCRPSYGL